MDKRQSVSDERSPAVPGPLCIPNRMTAGGSEPSWVSRSLEAEKQGAFGLAGPPHFPLHDEKTQAQGCGWTACVTWQRGAPGFAVRHSLLNTWMIIYYVQRQHQEGIEEAVFSQSAGRGSSGAGLRTEVLISDFTCVTLGPPSPSRPVSLFCMSRAEGPSGGAGEWRLRRTTF